MRHVVAGALIRTDRVLLGHRSPSRRRYPSVWDLPGGHIEPGESEPEALVRELREEIGVRVAARDAEPYAGIDLPGAVRLTVWRVRRWRGTPVNVCPDEHDGLGWFSAADLDDLALAHPSYRLMLGALLRG